MVICISPFELPDPGLVAAACRAGALGVLDLGSDRDAAVRAMRALAGAARAIGVRVTSRLGQLELPGYVTTVVAGDVDSVAWAVAAGRRVLAQVTTEFEARAAIAAGASGVIAKGCEAGGRVGDETTFVLLQRLLATLDVPVWAQGGIGMNTAAACLAGGAAGVVLDTQLALMREASPPAALAAAVATMDGSETAIKDGERVYARDGHAAHGVAIGQDGALAKPLARAFPTIGQLVHGLRRAVDGQIELAADLQPLAPGAPFAVAHKLRYPIAQGPMSRVSDRARFAEAVARAGGLPFLALTLMSGDETRALLTETRALLGDLPWGVGILGFVPPEIREAQLAVMKDIAPPIALIAGGRPSQAHPLEAQGTATYLHVPSPGLLELFLKDGARRFVFEGSECGGHVGPRTSFALWEAQLDKLMAFERPAELSIIFAGGIHDARSVAMVGAMVAPLAARGAKIGVLMGTAYLFTHEAVECGAIQPEFQRQAVACERTVLLETSPGHATRCADTEFAEQFAREKARLAADGVGAKEAWASLEQLNLGRLRVASKGLVRDGAAISDVDVDTQRREGMYMIGQVAALRRETISVAELHHRASDGARAWLVDAASRIAIHEDTSRGTDVAVIGIAAMFAGAPDTDAFWHNIITNKNSIREVPAERWDIATYYDPNAVGEGAGNKTPCKWGGFLDDIPFDPLAYGIPPKSLTAIEPVQLLSLEIARRAISDAGYDSGGGGAGTKAFDRARCAVIFGAEAGTDLSSAYNFRAMFPHYVGPLPEGLDDSLPRLSEDSFPGVLANVIAGRIANRLDLGGVNYTVDAACAASLAAVDLSVKELVSGSSDMVLCGGADLHNGINDYLMFASVHALSPTGQCHTFDAKADGIVLGEGVACIVLKRLADAERDGDRIYAVIKGVAGASDGKSLGLTAPRKDGQVRALDRAYRAAGVSPAEVGLVEAHGTGTVVGDKTELATLVEVYAKAGAGRGAAVLGSVKSQIGHTKCAAGIAGLIKTALAIHHGVLPPTSNLEKPNSAWDPQTSPFVFLDRARPWPAERRVAAVSAFGFGGTNFHAILASPRGATPEPARAWPAELLLLRGADRAAALELGARLERAAAGGARLRDLARTACARGHGPVQVAIVAESIDDLKTKLAAARAGNAPKGVSLAGGVTGKLAFLCPGQGSQKVGMMAELFVAFPRVHRWLALGRRWTPAIYPAQVFSREAKDAQQAALTDTRVAQPALGVVDMAVVELLESLGVQPDMAGGHSYGELAALCLAGAIADEDLLPLSAMRGEEILAAAGADPGTMVAVAADAKVVAPIIAGCDGVVIANHNSGKQCVLSGARTAMDMAMVLVKAAGLAAKPLPVACAFHSPVVAGAEPALARVLAGMDVRAPNIPVYANVTGQPYPQDGDGVRALLSRQVASPVRWADQIEAMYEAGARVFVETGPGQVLTRLVSDVLGARPHVSVGCDEGGGGVSALLRAVAAIAVSGADVDAAPLFWERDTVVLDLDAPPVAKRPGWVVNGHAAKPVSAKGSTGAGPAVVGGAASSSVSLTPSPARAPAVPATRLASSAPMSSSPRLSIPHAAAAAAAAAASNEPLVEYLRNMRAMISAQRDVMLAYLGASPAAFAQAPMEHHAPSRIEVGEVIDVAPIAAPVTVAVAPVAVAPAQLDPMQLVVSIVSERTGYPADTLGLDLDLEADLSIDSIKRIEIIGELAQRLGIGAASGGGADADAIVEELASRKTLRALVAWLTDRLATPAAAAEPEPSAPPAPYVVPDAVTMRVATPAVVAAELASHTTPAAAATVQRFELAIVPAPAPINGHSTLAGARISIVAGGAADVADELGRRLVGEGAIVATAGATDGAATVHVELATLDDVASLRALYARVRDAVLGAAKHVVIATRAGELGRARPGAGGAAGLAKTFAAEFPQLAIRVVDIPPELRASAAAALLHAELHASDAHVDIGYVDGARSTVELVPAPLAPEPAAPALPLDASSLVLVTGGARGITARAAIALAQRTGCTIALVGRSALPSPTAADPGGDAKALRAHFAASLPLAEVEAAAARVLADREIRATLAALGDRASYHAVDVRTPAFAALIDELYARHGGIAGVIHGAGVLDDKLIKHKTPDAFERVITTKLAGARTLATALRDDVRFIALFSSIVGAVGNRGQVDYAAAGDALDKLAWQLARRSRARVVSIDWGPWGGGGMVSAELEREYARRGLALIDPDAGVAALLAELARASGPAQVVMCASDPRAFARPRAAAAATARDAGAPRDDV
jgi:acyl transferase domain-containing protein/NAD(P)H-dependent flavin oxidoreductase YrpB (nitropropane dioxygenase family)|nr:SDR family NAD(P)-dependent oxidoreductase [Kofleriaceae bacterium]